MFSHLKILPWCALGNEGAAEVRDAPGAVGARGEVAAAPSRRRAAGGLTAAAAGPLFIATEPGGSLLPRCGRRRDRRQPQPRAVQPGATTARAPRRFPSRPRRGGRGRTRGAVSQGLTGREPPPP